MTSRSLCRGLSRVQLASGACLSFLLKTQSVDKKEFFSSGPVSFLLSSENKLGELEVKEIHIFIITSQEHLFLHRAFAAREFLIGNPSEHLKEIQVANGEQKFLFSVSLDKTDSYTQKKSSMVSLFTLEVVLKEKQKPLENINDWVEYVSNEMDLEI